MANEEHVALVKQGSSAWNAWRLANPDLTPNLNKANLRGTDLSGANLSKAHLVSVDLRGANLSEADLMDADLTLANLSETVLTKAHLTCAILSKADLSRADLSGAVLNDAILSGAHSTIRTEIFKALRGSGRSQLTPLRNCQPRHFCTSSVTYVGSVVMWCWLDKSFGMKLCLVLVFT